MSILTDPGCTWILFSGENFLSNDFHRFALDIDFAYLQLTAVGVQPAQIWVYLDSVGNSPVPTFLWPHVNFRNPKDLQSDLNTLTAKSVVFASTCHGDFNGIAGVNPLAPFPLVKALRSIRNVENVLMVLAQCFAGIFDGLDVIGDPKTVIIGATNLTESISSMGMGLNHQANIFWAWFFYWVRNPVDTDSDGVYSISDVFKFATLQTNAWLTRIKTEKTRTIESWCIQEVNAIQREQDPIKKEERDLKLTNLIKLYHTHQEPWILNAHAARRLQLR